MFVCVWGGGVNELCDAIHLPRRRWVAFDLLVYSPTITSGVSFSLMHFDVRFAFFENIAHTPQVDVCV